MRKFTLLIHCVILTFSVNAELLKLSNQGEVVNNTTDDFHCVLDEKTQLIWEVKRDKIDLQNKINTYTWFDGKTGVKDGKYSRYCHWEKGCNTQAFIAALNQTTLCKINTWRLPTEAELQTLIVYGDDNILINRQFFPHTLPTSYWSSSELNGDVAIDVPFFYGGVKSSDKSFDAHIRGVSNAH